MLKLLVQNFRIVSSSVFFTLPKDRMKEFNSLYGNLEVFEARLDSAHF